MRLMNAVPLPSPDDNVWLSGEKATCETPFSCSENVPTNDPSPVLHSRTVLSRDADATYSPHGEKHAAVTGPVCPLSDTVMARVSASQNFRVLSFDADSSSHPSCEKATLTTESVCSLSTNSRRPVCTSDTWMAQLRDASARRVLSASNTAATARPSPRSCKVLCIVPNVTSQMYIATLPACLRICRNASHEALPCFPSELER